MSLEAIRALRLKGQKPAGVVTVLLGAKPRWLDDGAELVVVRPADDPRFMDWRPLVGLSVVLLSAKADPARTLAAATGLEAVGAKFFGAADPSGAYPMLVGADDWHESVLRRHWEALCR